MSTLNGATLARIYSLAIPPAGSWIADISPLSGAAPALGPAALVVGDLTLVGSIVRSGLDAPDQARVTVMGGAGWRTILATAGSYRSPGGNVRLSSVLADLSRLAGEAIDAPPEAFLGSVYGWDASTPRQPRRARGVLAELVTRGAIATWRVDLATGRTRFDAWPTLPAADGQGRVMPRDHNRGVRRVALDSAASAFLPGATLEGATIRRVVFTETSTELSAEVWES